MAKAVIPGFECDLDLQTGWPRIRFNFKNGRTVSVVFRTGANQIDAPIASLALMERRKVTEVSESEAFPEEVAAYLNTVALMPPV